MGLPNTKKHTLPMCIMAAMAAGLGGCATDPGTPAYYAEQAADKHDQRLERVENTLDNLPEWYATPPRDDSMLYGVATAASEDLQMSIDKAILDAKRSIAEKMNSRISGKIRQYMEDHGGAEHYDSLLEESSKVTQSVFTEVDVAGFRVEKQKLEQEGEAYRSYVLVSFPLGQANRVMISKLRHNQQLDTVMKASKAYEDLEAEIAAASLKKD